MENIQKCGNCKFAKSIQTRYQGIILRCNFPREKLPSWAVEAYKFPGAYNIKKITPNFGKFCNVWEQK